MEQQAAVKPPPKGEPVGMSVDEKLEQAEFLFDQATRVFRHTIAEVENGRIVPETEVAKAIRTLVGCQKVLFEEKQKYERSKLKETDADPLTPIDFDKVRDEIECWFDRLRTA